MGVPEKVRNEVADAPVVHQPPLVAEVLEHLLERMIVLQPLDRVPHDSHVVVVEHGHDEGQHEKDPDKEDRDQEHDVVGGGLQDQREQVHGVVERGQGVGRVDPVVPAAELQLAELLVRDTLGIVW